MLDRNPPEFARLVGADDQMGWDENGPDYSRMAPLRQSGGEEEHGGGTPDGEGRGAGGSGVRKSGRWTGEPHDGEGCRPLSRG